MGSSLEGAVPVCVGSRRPDPRTPVEDSWTEFAELPEGVEDNSGFKESQDNDSSFSWEWGLYKKGTTTQ